MSEELVRKLAKDLGGEIKEMGRLPDGSGFAMMSMPLPKTHWLYKDDGFEAPPMPMRMGTDDPGRPDWEAKLRAAGRYAVRSATMNGKEMDFDPDALVQNLITGFLGYYTPDGLSTQDDWANPEQFRKKPK
jgi:hypothetical protein